MNQSVLLEYVDDIIFESEIDVLIAITESYQKALTMFEYVDYDDSIIQESFSIYMENDDNVSSIKNLFKKIISFFKNVCSKIGNIIQRCFNRNKKNYTTTYNFLLIVDELNRVFSSKTFTEYFEGNIDEEVFQEALFGRTKSEAEKEEEEINKRQKKQEKDTEKRLSEKEKELKKNTKQHDKEFEKFVRTLRRKFKPDSLTRNLSRGDIRDIVKLICVGATKDELIKLRKSVKDITDGNFEKVDKHIFDTMNLLTKTSTSVSEYKKVFDAKLKKNKVINSKRMYEADQEISRKQRLDVNKCEFDLKLLEAFSDTFGAQLNKLSGQDHFSFENLKALVYGSNKIFTIPATIATFTTSTVFNLLTKAAFALSMFNPKIIIDGIRECGKELNRIDDEFNDFADNDIQLRKEYGIRLNKTMQVVRVGILDNIKEETYRWEDCPFNATVYGVNANGPTMIAAGPLTSMVILVGTIVFHRPLEEFFPTVGSMAMLGFAKTLNPGFHSGKFHHLTY